MYKLIIVDDESGARDILIQYVKEFIIDFRIMGVFGDGEDAIEFLKSNDVDVVLTDVKMPKISGLEIAKYVYENKPRTKVVIISGFGEFEYAQEAMKYGVVYYLLKVIDVDEFVDVMAKIKETLDKEDGEKDHYENMALEREMFFYDLICGTFDAFEEVEKAYNSLNFNDQIADSVCNIFKIQFKDLDNFIEQKWHYDKEILKYTIANIVNLINRDWYVAFFRFTQDISILLIMRNRNSDNIDIAQITYELLQILDLEVSITQKYEKTIGALYHDDNSELYSHTELAKLVASHDIINNAMKEEPHTFNDVRGKGEMIDKAKKYIEDHFNENISRNDIADHVFLNPAYFGTVFKDIMKVSFSEYLLKVRMKKAIEYLSKGAKVERVCRGVGYSDVRNFRRVFKLYTGYTPAEYKEMIIKNGGGIDCEN